MLTTKEAQRIGRRLIYPCPLCGGVVFAILCGDADPGDIVADGEVCLVLDPSIAKSDSCHVFCSFVCNVRKIWIDANDVSFCFVGPNTASCGDANRMYGKLFRHLFSIVSLDKGFKI